MINFDLLKQVTLLPSDRYTIRMHTRNQVTVRNVIKEETGGPYLEI